MKVKNVLFGLLVVVAFVGFVSVGSVRALDWVDWSGTWFKVTVSENGYLANVVPPGGSVVTNKEKSSTTYFLIDTWDLSTTSYSTVYCTFDGSVWTQNTPEPLFVFGLPTNFLTYFGVTYEDAQASIQTYGIPLNVKGKEEKNTPHTLKSASFINVGGTFYEVRPTERGVGSVKFKGSLIKPDKVADQVPLGCRVL